MPSCQASRFEVGDWITYRYEGAVLARPIVLEERIVDRQGARMTIEVRRQSGDEVRTWRMVVTDTPENRAAEETDRLIELGPAGPRELPNTAEERRRLFEGAYVVPEIPLHRVSVESKPMRVCGVERTCRVVTSRTRVMGRSARWREITCADVPWSHVGQDVVAEDDGTRLFERAVVDWGRAPARTPPAR